MLATSYCPIWDVSIPERSLGPNRCGLNDAESNFARAGRAGKLELKFAMQLGVPIVPVLGQPKWQQSGWLGIVTAGALWTPIFAESDIDENIDKLVMQIHLAVQLDEGGAVISPHPAFHHFVQNSGDSY
jgi:hypothetical protein